MANSYTDVDKFKEWMPTGYLAQLTDDAGGTDPNEPILQKALDWGANLMESKLSVRDDIPIPAISANNTVNETLRECVHDLALYKLLNRRSSMNDSVREQFDVQMTWLGDIAARRANIDIRDASDEEVTKTTETPIIDGNQERKFDDFTF